MAEIHSRNEVQAVLPLRLREQFRKSHVKRMARFSQRRRLMIAARTRMVIAQRRLHRSSSRRTAMLDAVLSAPVALLYVCGVELLGWMRRCRARAAAR